MILKKFHKIVSMFGMIRSLMIVEMPFISTSQISFCMTSITYLRRGELGGELRGLGLARPQEGARLERHDRPRVQPQRPRVRGEVAEEARRVEKAHLQR